MAVYGFSITTQGSDLLSKLLSAEKPLVLSKVVFGSGKASATTVEELATQTSLISELGQGALGNVHYANENMFVTVAYSNSMNGGITSNTNINEFIIYAKDLDESDVPFVYATLGDNPEVLLPYNGSSAYVRKYQISIHIGSVAGVATNFNGAQNYQVSTTPPTDYSLMWIDTSDNNALKLWDGTNWIYATTKHNLVNVPGGVVLIGEDGKIPAEFLQVTGNPLLFGDTDGESGLWDRKTTAPTAQTPIRYNGYLRATRLYGMYYSDDADYAEAYPVDMPIRPGQLVMITKDGRFKANTIKGNPRILGIVSTKPASVIGNIPGRSNVPIAMMGRIPALVDCEVAPGDYLMGSDKPGYLTKATNDCARGAIVGQVIEPPTENTYPYATVLIVRL